MSRTHRLPLAVLLLLACDPKPVPTPAPEAVASEPEVPQRPSLPETLSEARKGFETKLVSSGPEEAPAPPPPKGVPFELITYPSAVGSLAAYVSTDPKDRKKHPAIVWLTGGDTNSIGAPWVPMDPSNDQTAGQYRDAGIVMMYPSQRGGNDNPGQREGFLGEVDDVIAATEYLRALPFVDPERVYLGGHSTGGTLAMLVAETTDLHRATFAFGPVNEIGGYGGDYTYHDASRREEELVRSPVRWLGSIRKPTFVIEGQDGNWIPLHAMMGANENPLITFIPLRNTDHFGVLAPVNAVIAAQIVSDTGPEPSFTLTQASLQPLFPG